jgi:hypothetical protein
MILRERLIPIWHHMIERHVNCESHPDYYSPNATNQLSQSYFTAEILSPRLTV